MDVITESSCSRYIEFRAVSGIYNYNGLIEQVLMFMYHKDLLQQQPNRAIYMPQGWCMNERKRKKTRRHC